jgi:hypothetical protein
MPNYVCVKTYETREEAEMAKGLLEANDIDALVFADDIGGTTSSILASTGGARLMVAKTDAKIAASILSDAEDESEDDKEVKVDAEALDDDEDDDYIDDDDDEEDF